MRQKERETKQRGGFLLKAAGAWLLTAALLLFPAAAFLHVRRFPAQTLAYVSAAVSFLAAVAAGAAAGRQRRGGALVTAFLTAMVLIICLLTVGYLIRGKAPEPAGVLSVVSFTLAGCAFGAVFFSTQGKRAGRQGVRL